MSEIRISGRVAGGAVVLATAVVAAAVARQLPEIRRYLRIEAM